MKYAEAPFSRVFPEGPEWLGHHGGSGWSWFALLGASGMSLDETTFLFHQFFDLDIT